MNNSRFQSGAPERARMDYVTWRLNHHSQAPVRGLCMADNPQSSILNPQSRHRDPEGSDA
jgi:hypothetical protein